MSRCSGRRRWRSRARRRCWRFHTVDSAGPIRGLCAGLLGFVIHEIELSSSRLAPVTGRGLPDLGPRATCRRLPYLLEHVLIRAWISVSCFSPVIAASPRRRPPRWPRITGFPRSTCPSTPTSRSNATPPTPPPGTRPCPTTATCAPWTPGCRWAPPPRSPPGSGCPPRWPCPSNTTPSRWPNPSPPSITSPAAGSASASDSAGTPTNWPTTTCRPGGGAPCCANTWRPCAPCGPRKKPPTTANSSSSGRRWAWPKPVQPHIPVLVGAAGTEKNFKWIARIGRRLDHHPARRRHRRPGQTACRTPGPRAGRDGAPQIVALDFKPDPDKLARWQDLGVTEVLFGLPDKPDADVAAYVERLAGKLAALNRPPLERRDVRFGVLTRVTPTITSNSARAMATALRRSRG